jgi:hypothetical protein
LNFLLIRSFLRGLKDFESAACRPGWGGSLMRKPGFRESSGAFSPKMFRGHHRAFWFRLQVLFSKQLACRPRAAARQQAGISRCTRSSFALTCARCWLNTSVSRKSTEFRSGDRKCRVSGIRLSRIGGFCYEGLLQHSDQHKSLRGWFARPGKGFP